MMVSGWKKMSFFLVGREAGYKGCNTYMSILLPLLPAISNVCPIDLSSSLSGLN